MMPLPALPNVNWAGIANADTLNQALMLCCWPLVSTLGFENQFGLSVAVMAAEWLCACDTGAARIAANHWPVYMVHVPDKLQAPTTWANRPRLRNWRPA